MTSEDRIEQIYRIVNEIDTSIKGDESRGLVGMKQHIHQINENYEKLEKENEQKFSSIKEAQHDIEYKINTRVDHVEKKIEKATYWLMGAAAVIGFVFMIIDKIFL
jgi:hypothetical protein